MRQNLEEFFRNLLKYRISRKKFLKAGILSLLFASKGENKRENGITSIYRCPVVHRLRNLPDKMSGKADACNKNPADKS